VEGWLRARPQSGDRTQFEGVFTAQEREQLVAAFRKGKANATEEELATFVEWARGVRIEGGMLTLILQGVALPIRPEGDGGYQFRAATEAEQQA
jgi:hypothetical protein